MQALQEGLERQAKRHPKAINIPLPKRLPRTIAN